MTTESAIRAMLDGKKVNRKDFVEEVYAYEKGVFFNQYGMTIQGFGDNDDWEIYEEIEDCRKVGLEMINRGLKFDKDKVMLSLVSSNFVYGVGEVLTFGAKKYAPNSWQTVPDAKKRYEDALYRHWLAYLNGERIDKESGLSHLKHLATNAMFLLHFEK